ncbi:hypothetical protein [Demequina sp.]|uniref:hypothetical protein n=1 Tax=Demequina sp. TaxID=2050685 RepID=UPI0025BB178F|nr:hypothetical protein [Demequina sp.]
MTEPTETTPAAPPRPPRIGILGNTFADAQAAAQALGDTVDVTLISTYSADSAHRHVIDALLITPYAIRAPRFDRALANARPAMATSKGVSVSPRPETEPTETTPDVEARRDPRHAIITGVLRHPSGVDRGWAVRHVQGLAPVGADDVYPVWLSPVDTIADFIVNELRAADTELAPTVRLESAGPEAGHTFEVSVRSRPSANVVGEPKHDADWFSEPDVLRVRAWNRRDALRMAAQVPMPDWVPTDTQDAGPSCPTCSWPLRETTGLVCQTCGKDYGNRTALDWQRSVRAALRVVPDPLEAPNVDDAARVILDAWGAEVTATSPAPEVRAATAVLALFPAYKVTVKPADVDAEVERLYYLDNPEAYDFDPYSGESSFRAGYIAGLRSAGINAEGGE